MSVDPYPRRPLLPALVMAGASLVAVLAAFMPWYAPDLGPPLSPDSVSGWDATVAAKILVAASLACALAGLVLVLDARDLIALDAGGTAALAVAAAVAAGCGVVAVAYRTVRIPEPAALLARELGLYLALGMAVVALVAALVEVVLSADTGGRRRSPAARTRRTGPRGR